MRTNRSSGLYYGGISYPPPQDTLLPQRYPSPGYMTPFPSEALPLGYPTPRYPTAPQISYPYISYTSPLPESRKYMGP